MGDYSDLNYGLVYGCFIHLPDSLFVIEQIHLVKLQDMEQPKAEQPNHSILEQEESYKLEESRK